MTNSTALMVVPPSLREQIAKWTLERRERRHNDPKNVRRREKYVSKAKFKPGRFVRSLNELVRQRAVYWNGRYLASGWFKSWQVSYALNEIKGRSIRLVVERDNTK